MIKKLFDAKKRVKINFKSFNSLSVSSTFKQATERSVDHFYIKGIKEKLFQQSKSQVAVQNFYIPILFNDKIYLAKVRLKNMEQICVKEGRMAFNLSQS